MYRENEKYPLLILLRDDLETGISMAQACHAAYEYGRAYGNVITNGYLYVLKVDKDQLELWGEKLEFERTPHILFREPDMENEPTALCCSINPNRMNKHKKY